MVRPLTLLACTYFPAIPSSWPLISSRRRCPGWPKAIACGAQWPGHRWRDVDDPVDVGGVGLYGALDSIDSRVVHGRCRLRHHDFHRPRARRAGPREHGRRPGAASGIGWRARTSDDRINHVRAAAGGLDPIEGNSATHAAWTLIQRV